MALRGLVGAGTAAAGSDLQKAILLVLAEWDRAASGRGEVVLTVDTRLDELNLFAPDLLWYRLELGPTDVLESPLLPGFRPPLAELYPE